MYSEVVRLCEIPYFLILNYAILNSPEYFYINQPYLPAETIASLLDKKVERMFHNKTFPLSIYNTCLPAYQEIIQIYPDFDYTDLNPQINKKKKQ
jgi:hypothetical protein